MHIKEMKKDEEMKEKRYKKSALRKTLEENMRARWRNELTSERMNAERLTVTPMEFSRWLKIYCEIKGLPEELQKAKTLPESVVDGFGAWLGDPLR
jgi:hypothetical protein